MSFTKCNAIILFTLLFCAALAAPAFAIDPPHAESMGVACNSCHDHWLDSPGSTIDETSMNILCWSCHSVAGGHFIKNTHSGITTDSQTKYGTNWTTQCIDCHDPHYQKQALLHGSDYSAGGAYLESGTIGAFDTAGGGIINVVVSSANPGWTPDQWKDYTVIIGSNRLIAYYIIGSTADGRLTVATKATGILVGSRFAQAGDPFHIVYGKYIKDQVRAPRAIVNSSGVVYDAGLYRDVMFFNSTGAHSPAVSMMDDTAICVVCHTRTKVFNIGYVVNGNSFDTIADYPNQSHKDRVSDTTTCWDNASCHRTPAEGFDANCAGCHGSPPVDMATMINTPALEQSGRDNPGKHAAHATKGFDNCDYCHKGGGPEGTDSHSTSPYSLSMGFTHGLTQGTYSAGTFPNDPPFTAVSGDGVTSVVYGGAPSATAGTCTSIYCHSDGTGAGGVFQTVTWAAAEPSLGCNKCHGDSAGTDYVVTGKHTMHAYGDYNFACYECHDATVDATNTVKASGTHVNTFKDVSFGNISSGGTYGATCSNLYCHSNAQGTSYKTPSWTDGAMTCTSCHDTGGAASTLSAAHSEHTSATGLNAQCADCHHDTVSANNSPVTGFARHVDGNKDVVPFGFGADGADYDSATGTCATLDCHGSRSPAWTADFTGKDTCVRCHGDSTAAAPATDAQKAPGGAGADTNGDTDALDKQVGAHQAHLTSAANYTEDVACTDCHNVPATVLEAGHLDSTLPAELNFSAFAGNFGSLTPSYDPATGTCSSVYCHGAAMPNASNTGLDTTPVWNAVSYLSGTPDIAGGDCDQCHGSPPGGYTPNTHSGAESISQCSGCHDHLNNDGSIANIALHINGMVEAAGCTGCHGQPPVDAATLVNSPAATGHTEGAHAYHWSKFSGDGCVICHTGGGAGGHTGIKNVTMGFSYMGNTGGLYNSTGDFLNGFGLRSGDAGLTTVGYGAARTCSSIYCHSDGGDYAGTKTYKTVDWDSNFNFPTDCDKCHGDGAGQKVITNVHPTHVATYDLNCNTCHAGTVDAGLNLIGNHVNGTKQVIFNSGPLAGGGDYSGRPNCSNIYCHSQGTVSYAAPNTSPSWNTGTLDCAGCHDNTAASGTPMATGSHTSHINNSAAIGRDFSCVECHIGTVDTDTSIGVIANHVDGTRDVVINATIGGSYAAGDCSSVYCHSDGNSDGTMTYKTVTWNTTTTDCTSCHGDGSVAYPNYANAGVGPDSNSHDPHVNPAKSNLGCKECHNTTSTTGVAIDGTDPAQHVDQTVDMAFVQGGLYNATDETCSTTYCHGAGASPAWGTLGPLSCDTCHPADKTGLPGSHAMHYNTTVAATGAERTAGKIANSSAYVFTCGVCHDGAVHAGGPANAPNMIANVIFDATVAGGGTYTEGALGGTDASGRNWTQGTCSTTYCHSKGEGTAGNVTPQWGVSSMTCASCHDALPATGTHASHINNATVMDDKACDTCHSVTATGSTAIANTLTHVSGAPDVDLNASWGGSYTDPNCSSVYCHSDGKGTFATADWKAGANADCAYCHGGAGGSTGGATTALSTPHTVHTDAAGFAYACDSCHSETVNATDDGIINTTLHLNKTKDVFVSSALGGDGGDYAGNTCATTNCHGDRSTDWTVGGTTGDCSLCHGMADAGKSGRDTNGDTLGTDLEVGAHEAHLKASTLAFGSISADVACSSCHVEPAGATYEDKVNAASHMDGPGAGMRTELTWSGLANAGGLSPAYDPATGQCSNTYCHGNNMPKGSNPGVGSTPVWNSTGYIAGSSFDNDCSQCHGFPPTEHATHAAMTVGDGTNCNNCHTHLNDAIDANESGWTALGTAFSNASLHVDGIVQGGGDCNSCHGFPPDPDIDGAGPDTGDGMAYIGNGLEGKGAHPKHIAHLEALVGNALTSDATGRSFTDADVAAICGVCHDTSNDANHMNGDDNREMLVPASYQFGPSLPTYNGQAINNATLGGPFKSCSNVSCHFKETPGWQDPATAGQ